MMVRMDSIIYNSTASLVQLPSFKNPTPIDSHILHQYAFIQPSPPCQEHRDSLELCELSSYRLQKHLSTQY